MSNQSQMSRNQQNRDDQTQFWIEFVRFWEHTLDFVRKSNKPSRIRLLEILRIQLISIDWTHSSKVRIVSVNGSWFDWSCRIRTKPKWYLWIESGFCFMLLVKVHQPPHWICQVCTQFRNRIVARTRDPASLCRLESVGLSVWWIGVKHGRFELWNGVPRGNCLQVLRVWNNCHELFLVSWTVHFSAFRQFVRFECNWFVILQINTQAPTPDSDANRSHNHKWNFRIWNCQHWCRWSICVFNPSNASLFRVHSN